MPSMDSAAPRPLRLGGFDVRTGTVFAVDESLPVAAEIDAATGETVRVFSWLLSGDHRGRPTALDILGRDDSVLIASPAARAGSARSSGKNRPAKSWPAIRR